MESNYRDPINIGNPNEFSIKEIASYIKNLINPNLEFVYKILPEDDPKQRKPSIELAKRILGWEPKFDLNDGLIKSIEWFKGEFDLFS